MVQSLPLRTGYFAVPRISPSEEVELHSWARSLVPELLSPNSEWTILSERKGVQISEDRQKGGLTYSLKAVAVINVTLDDVMEMFGAFNTMEYRSLMQVQLREFFVDAAVLYHKRMTDVESLSVKWLAMRNKKTAMSPISPVVQDFCMLEYHGALGSDLLGGDPAQPFGVCLMESIEQQECPSLYETHRVERASISKCGYLFLPRPNGMLEVQFVCSIRQPPNQRGKRKLNRSILLNWGEAVGVIEESIHRRRIGRDLTLRRTPTWVNDKDRRCCHLCLKTFTNTRRRHHCRACGEIICGGCSLYKSVDLQSVGLTTLRVCKSCMDGTSVTNNSISGSPRSTSNSSLSMQGQSYGNGYTYNNIQSPPIDNGESPPYPQRMGRMQSGLTSSYTNSNDSYISNPSLEEPDYALALPHQKQHHVKVPDLVGVTWLRQIAQRDPSKTDMVNDLMAQLHIDADEPAPTMIPEDHDESQAHDYPRSGSEDSQPTEQVDIYDTLCDLAAQTLSCKYAVVSLVDENRQWFKSAVNVKEEDVPRDFSFCEFPVADKKPLVVMDALLDPRFRDNPFVNGPLGVRFLAGAPLFTVQNECVGSVCVLDTEPRQVLQENQIATMQNLAHLAMVMVQERREAQAKLAAKQKKAFEDTQLVTLHTYGGMNHADDMVPLNPVSQTYPTYNHHSSGRSEDPIMKRKMMELLAQASLVSDQLNNNLKQQVGSSVSGSEYMSNSPRGRDDSFDFDELEYMGRQANEVRLMD